MKKLKLNDKKNVKIHVGKDEKKCPATTTYENDCIILKSSESKYLGDIISKDGKNIKNIKNRTAIAIGKIATIMNILTELILGNHYFVTAILFKCTFIKFRNLVWYNRN